METALFKTIVISFVNIKGGVAKSISSLFVAWALALMGYRTLLVDMDPQSNSTYTLTGELNELPDGTLYEVLKEKPTKSMRSILTKTKQPNLWVAPGSLWLSSTEIELISATSREFVLKGALVLQCQLRSEMASGAHSLMRRFESSISLLSRSSPLLLL